MIKSFQNQAGTDQQLDNQRRLRPEQQYLECEECGNSWMEEIRVMRKSRHYTAVPGQSIPQAKGSPGPFILIRCVRCSTVFEPNMAGISYKQQQAYDTVMDELRTPPTKDVSASNKNSDEKQETSSKEK